MYLTQENLKHSNLYAVVSNFMVISPTDLHVSYSNFTYYSILRTGCQPKLFLATIAAPNCRRPGSANARNAMLSRFKPAKIRIADLGPKNTIQKNDRSA